MNWRKFGKLGAFAYLSLYGVAMLLPRKVPNSKFSAEQGNFLERLVHSCLYYGGVFEPLANVFFLIPIFAFSVWIFGSKYSRIILFGCIALSAGAELLQRFIAGRVSSIRDFVLNSMGVILCYLIQRIFLNRRSNSRGK